MTFNSGRPKLSIMDLPDSVIATDPVLCQLRERIAAAEAEIVECQRLEVEREDWLRSERTRKTYGLA